MLKFNWRWTGSEAPRSAGDTQSSARKSRAARRGPRLGWKSRARAVEIIATPMALGSPAENSSGTAAEKFATLFGGYFIDALVGDAADVDRNKRVSVLEAFDAAKREVARRIPRADVDTILGLPARLESVARRARTA